MKGHTYSKRRPNGDGGFRPKRGSFSACAQEYISVMDALFANNSKPHASRKFCRAVKSANRARGIKLGGRSGLAP